MATRGGKKKWTSGIILMGVFATALFYGDSMITPAISVLSAVEGLTTVNTGLQPFVIPIAIAILVGLFAIQARGTARVGLMFGPVMLFYFGVLAVLGVMHIMDYPAVLTAMINPVNIFDFFAADFMRAFVALGSVVLAVTGAEALYADLGLFGHPASDPARLRAAPQDQPHQRKRCGADLHPDRQLGADDDGHHPRPDLPQFVQPCRRLWHRGGRCDADRQRADLSCVALHVD